MPPPNDPTHADAQPIRVKLIAKHPYPDPMVWRRQLPSAAPDWGRCRFTFDADDPGYDWLVVYDELPKAGVTLQCPAEHTLLVTVEPPSIKVYGSAYLRQFGAVLTSHEPWALRHPRAIRSMPALQWFYGMPMQFGQSTMLSLDEIRAMPNNDKPKTIATVCSAKRMGHTLHRLRYDLVQRLRAEVPEIDVFGHGVRPIDDKAESVDPYRYHVAIENHLAPHHITEKLTDVFLGGALPFYFGAPNAADYFPADSFIPIDVRRPDEAVRTIRTAIDSNAYDKRLPAIREAKRRVLDEHNLFAVLSRAIERLDSGRRGGDGGRLINRRVKRSRNPLGALAYLVERYRVQGRVKRGARR